MATKTDTPAKPSRKQQEQIEEQNALLEELLGDIEKKKGDGSEPEFRIFIGFDVLINRRQGPGGLERKTPETEPRRRKRQHPGRRPPGTPGTVCSLSSHQKNQII